MMNININNITRIFKHFVSALVRRRGNFLYIAPLNITFEEELGKQKFNIGIVNWDFFPLVVPQQQYGLVHWDMSLWCDIASSCAHTVTRVGGWEWHSNSILMLARDYLKWQKRSDCALDSGCLVVGMRSSQKV